MDHRQRIAQRFASSYYKHPPVRKEETHPENAEKRLRDAEQRRERRRKRNLRNAAKQ